MQLVIWHNTSHSLVPRPPLCYYAVLVVSWESECTLVLNLPMKTRAVCCPCDGGAWGRSMQVWREKERGKL